MSCGISMPKYVITSFLTYFIQYTKLAWGGRNYVEKQFFHVINITEFRATNILAFFHPNSFTETKQ